MAYKILDLFAGAGGLSLGFEMTELFSVSAIVENNKNAVKTYTKNHPGLKTYDDILEVDFNKLISEIGQVDVVIGGPPCQGFSNANRQRRQLINGSNELVKRYVKAIQDIRPNVFVMENVKTIASVKHSFCLTNADRDYIEDQLGLQIHDKEVVLYEGSNITSMCGLYADYRENVDAILLLSEEQLYFLYNIYKKKDKLKKYFEKAHNVKKVQEIQNALVVKENLPDWYNQCTENAKRVIGLLLSNYESVATENLYALKRFWDIQRFFQGILELNSKDAIYTVYADNHTIKIRMRTYIVIDYIRRAFENLGYVTNGGVLNAAAFGVPQTRERYILIGVNKNYREYQKEEIKLPLPVIENFEEYISVREAIEDLQLFEPKTISMDEDIERNAPPEIDSFYKKMVMDANSKIIHNHVCTDTRKDAKARFQKIGIGQNFHDLPDELKSTYENPERTQNTIYRRLDPEKPSDTVVNVRKSMWIHPTLDRAVSAREAARLQSFPDNYKFYGTKDSVYQQIGNAVPPLLGRAVAESVLNLLGNQEDYVTIRSIFDEMKDDSID